MKARLSILVMAFALGAGNGSAATPSVATGYAHSLAVHADGTLRTWGNDGDGALGVARSLQSPNAITVNGLSNVISVAAGYSHTVALRGDGTVWAWGDNSGGQLGDGTNTGRSTPIQVPDLAGIDEISAGTSHTLARGRDGTVWAWGTNYVGQLGDERFGGGKPQRVAGMTGVTAIAAGGEHSLAVRSDGTVWAWGRNDDGQLGDGTTTALYAGRWQPQPVVGLTAAITKVAGGDDYSLALTSGGTVFAWGANTDGNLGDGTTTRRLAPIQVPGLAGITAIGARSYSAALRNDGTVWAWGSNGYGQLGDGTFENRPAPVQLPNLANVASIAIGFIHSGAVTAQGAVFMWGSNERGQLGDGTTQRKDAPVEIPVRGIVRLSMGAYFTVAAGTDGLVRTWGDGASGQLGDGARVFRSTPSEPGVAGLVAVAGGGHHSLALKADGTVLAAGNNESAQLGDGTTFNSAVFVPVKDLTGVAQISAGAFHSLARKGDGTVWAWGTNYNGVLGVGEGIQTLAPIAVGALSNVLHVSAGRAHSLAVRGDGTVWAWGENESGQLGDGTTSNRFLPVQVMGLSGVVEVAAGSSHSMARKADGSVWTWGSNYEGQLGIGTTVDSHVPVHVPDVVAASIAAGSSTSGAIGRDGGVYVWGANYASQLGDGTTDERDSPVRLAGISTAAQLALGGSHGIAMLADGSALAWGENPYGQIGDGTLVGRPSPVVIRGEDGEGTLEGNDWFLDLNPAVASSIAPERVPVFLVVARPASSDVVVDIQYRAQDVGTTASTFVFALAPVTMIHGATAKSALPGFYTRGSSKDAPIACALAQLNAQGQLVAVSAASLQAYVSGVLSNQGASVNILKNVPPSNVSGATFYVGYGANGNAMLINGTTRSVVNVPASLNCQPQPPQTGWWYNPAEPGRGFSIESRGRNIFFAAFHYDPSGRATWNFAAGGTSLDGSLFTGDFLGAQNGQTLTGAYKLPSLTPAGNLTLAFSDATHGTMTWPGGSVAIERQPFVPNGLSAAPQANQPESGWWWNPNESGRGFFIEWQGGVADLAGYMYDDAGNPTWYISAYATPDARAFEGNWWTFAGGQSMGGAFRPATRTSDNVGSVKIDFTTTTTATMTLPDGRRIALERQRF